MKRFCVIGHPVAHSLSPLLHATAFRLLGLECSYDSFDVDPGALRARIDEFRNQGISGLNVTLPHKEAVVPLVDELSDEARAVGAVNTLSLHPGRIRGDNTDVDGFAASIEPFRAAFEQRPVLVLGAGGSARAIVYALLTGFNSSGITIVNRHEERARDLVLHFQPEARSSILRAATGSHGTLPGLVDEASLIVNCTSVGMSPSIGASPLNEEVRFHDGQVVMDLVYTPLQTRLLSLADEQGARTISGVEMFLHQGARSFQIWLDRIMPVDEVRPVIIEQLRRQQRGEH